MKLKSTKKALMMSVLSLFLCVAMLAGTTYAWFTDSVTSSANKIVAGTLKIDLELLETDGTWTSIKTDPKPIFDYDKWEPGYAAVKILKIENEGTLALKWKAKFVSSEPVNKLADVIDVYVLPTVPGEAAPTYPAADQRDLVNLGYTKVGTLAEFINTIESTTNGVLLEDELAYLAIALVMQTSAGNEYQGEGLEAFDIQILATQMTNEKDSFDDQYDADASLDWVAVSNVNELKTALANEEEHIMLTKDVIVDEPINIDYDVTIDGQGKIIDRFSGTSPFAMRSAVAAEPFDGTLITIAAGSTVELKNITVDGGAVWTGEIDPVLQRGTVNTGIEAKGYLIHVQGNANLILGEGAVVQNNSGANAIYLDTRTGGSLTVNGAQIINNASGAGAIWGGGNITVNEGSKINGNASTYLGGVVRFVGGNITFTMNGGEMNHNYTTASGGALGGGGKSGWYGNTFILNGGEMAYNACGAEGAGGAIYTNEHATVVISGDFTMHDNTCGSGLGNAIRFAKYSSLTMTGGNIYDNGDSAFWSYWTGINVTGGVLDNGGQFYIAQNGEPTVGGGDIKDTYYFNLGIDRNEVNLIENFGTFSFMVNETVGHFSNFKFKPAAGYTYVEGDEAKLICLNEGYETYWDAATGTFRLQAIVTE